MVLAVLLHRLTGVKATPARSSALVVPDSGYVTPSDVTCKEYLVLEGLACCTDVIMRKSGWFTSGGGVDQVSDIRFLTDDLITRLPIPRVKQNVLRSLASKSRERERRHAAHERRKEGWTHFWLENMLAAADTLARGFMLGFGLSFIYESLLLNRDFYTAADDLAPRVRRASFRAAALGAAVALTMHGASMFVPHMVRHSWLAGMDPMQ